MAITEFRGEYYFLSNFYESPVTYEGITYRNNEAAFQSAKLIDKKAREVFKDLNPSEAKKLGRKILLRPDWEEVKTDIMKEICRAKFSNPALKEKLLSTKDEYLEEGNTWRDMVWGTYKGKGQNRLGKILMEIRDELKSE